MMTNQQPSSSRLTSLPGWVIWVNMLGVFWKIMRIAFRQLRSPRKILLAFRYALQRNHLVKGKPTWRKGFVVEDKIYWRFNLPAYPSKALDQVIINEVNSFVTRSPQGLIALIFAVTKKCPLACEHCFEWDQLNQMATLSLEEKIEIIRRFQQYGVGQVFLSGGEPLVEWREIVRILEAVDANHTDFWLITSGFQLTTEKAQTLKEAGLRGVLVSLDHFDPQAHNTFRGNTQAYDWAIEGVKNAQAAGLVTALSLCVTQDFTTQENISRYMDLAKALGVLFVQFLEPKAKGRYLTQDVSLSTSQIQILETAYLTYNTQKPFRDYPIISHVDFTTRQMGCQGQGKMYLYVDTDGYVQPCPFCNAYKIPVKNMPISSLIERLQAGGCGMADS